MATCVCMCAPRMRPTPTPTPPHPRCPPIRPHSIAPHAAGIHGQAVAFSPYHPDLLATVGAQYYGIAVRAVMRCDGVYPGCF